MEKLPIAARRVGISLSLAGQYARRGDWPGAIQSGTRGEWWVPPGSEPTRAPNRRRVTPGGWQEIFRRIDAGERAAVLAREYGIETATIYSRKSRAKSQGKPLEIPPNPLTHD